MKNDDRKQDEITKAERVAVSEKDASEISDDELENVAGGVGKHYSKTIIDTSSGPTRDNDWDHSF